MNTSILKIPVLVAAIVVTAALAACGSGNEKPVAAAPSMATSTQSTPPTTTEARSVPELPPPYWTSSADAICARADQQLQALPNPTTAGEFVTFDSELVGILEAMESDLRALGPPPGHEPAFEEMLGFYRQARSSFERAGESEKRFDAATPADETATPELNRVYEAGFDATYEAAVIALQLGSDKCGAAAVTTVELNEVDGSGQTGEAEVSPISPDQLKIVLTLENAPAAAEIAQIYVGRCESLSVAVTEYALEDVVGGRSESTVETSFEELIASLHHYSIVISDAGTSAPVACGTLPVP